MIKKFFIKDKFSAVVEFLRVDAKGHVDLDGDYIYVENAFIKPEFRSLRYLREIIRGVAKKFGEATFIYFNLKKYKGRISPLYKISQLTR